MQKRTIAPNVSEITLPNGVTLGYSYDTVVTIHRPGYGYIVSENLWSTTTGRHLGLLAPKGHPRTPRDDFENILDHVTAA